MPRPRDPFRIALASLRDRARRGVQAPGEPVVILDEAARLRLSTTPIREALAWLGGEGLLDRTPKAGYRAPLLDAALLRDRLWLRLHYLTAGLALAAPFTPSPDTASADAGAPDLFDRIIRAAGNRALTEAFGRLEAQLDVAVQAEPDLFEDLAEETRLLLRVEAAGSAGQLQAAIGAYHRRRIDRAALIVLQVERRARRSREGV